MAYVLGFSFFPSQEIKTSKILPCWSQWQNSHWIQDFTQSKSFLQIRYLEYHSGVIFINLTLFSQNKNSSILVSLCVALTETFLLENWFTVLELNALTKTHKTAVDSAALTALHSANNTISGLKREINKKHKGEGLLSCLHKLDRFRYVTLV